MQYQYFAIYTDNHMQQWFEQMSLHHPDIFYMVMDKIGKRAIVTGDFCVYRERISDGYFTVATFKGGKQI